MGTTSSAHDLRKVLDTLEHGDRPDRRTRAAFAFGLPALDTLLGGGLARGAVHEFYAAAPADTAAAAGLVCGLMLRGGLGRASILWVRQRQGANEFGAVYGHGLAEMGLDPERVVFVEVRDIGNGLRAVLEAMRCKGLGAVLFESWGASRHFDLTATRRLALAGRESGVTGFLVRANAESVPSAATSRWRVRAAPSHSPGLRLPGAPAFEVELLRYRFGPAGQRWLLEWNHDTRSFAAPALPGAVAALSFDRAVAPAGPHRRRHAG